MLVELYRRIHKLGCCETHTYQTECQNLYPSDLLLAHSRPTLAQQERELPTSANNRIRRRCWSLIQLLYLRYSDSCPNIGSELDSYTGDGSGSFRRGTGAIALMSKMTLGYEPGTATLNNAWRTAAFSAQRSNSAYGNAETVQPLSLRVLALIRAF